METQLLAAQINQIKLQSFKTAVYLETISWTISSISNINAGVYLIVQQLYS